MVYMVLVLAWVVKAIFITVACLQIVLSCKLAFSHGAAALDIIMQTPAEENRVL